MSRAVYRVGSMPWLGGVLDSNDRLNCTETPGLSIVFGHWPILQTLWHVDLDAQV